MKKLFFEILQNSQETPVSESLLNKIAATLLKETPTGVLSYKFCEIFRNTYFASIGCI